MGPKYPGPPYHLKSDGKRWMEVLFKIHHCLATILSSSTHLSRESSKEDIYEFFMKEELPDVAEIFKTNKISGRTVFSLLKEHLEKILPSVEDQIVTAKLLRKEMKRMKKCGKHELSSK